MSDVPEKHRFLTDERIDQVADQVEPMLRDDLSWIERRKERVSIIDDTALRRQISIDFSLRREALPLPNVPPDSNGDSLFCAPGFVLPKTPAHLMSFDLCDESGHS